MVKRSSPRYKIILQRIAHLSTYYHIHIIPRWGRIWNNFLHFESRLKSLFRKTSNFTSTNLSIRIFKANGEFWKIFEKILSKWQEHFKGNFVFHVRNEIFLTLSIRTSHIWHVAVRASNPNVSYMRRCSPCVKSQCLIYETLQSVRQIPTSHIWDVR